MANAKTKLAANKKAKSFFEGWMPYLVVFAFSFAIYANSIFNDYNLDDELVTREHRLTKNGIGGIPQIFKEPYYKDEVGNAYEFRPIVMVSFAIEHSFFGEHAGVSHFINVFLYALTCVLLAYYLSRLLSEYSPWVPFIITILFAAHPIHTEVVASIKNRDEILALGFSLLAAYSALKFYETGRWYWLVLMPLVFITALLSKQTSIIFLVLVPLALIFFKKPAYSQVIVFTALLGLIAFPVINIPSILYKLAIVFGSLALVTFFFLLLNDYLSLSFLKNLWEKMVESFRADTNSGETQQADKLWPFDANELTSLSNLLAFVLPVTILVAVAIVGIAAWNAVILYTPLLLLCLLFYRAKPTGKLVTLTGLYVVLMAMAVSIGISEKFIYYTFVILGVLLYFKASAPFRFWSIAVVLVTSVLLIVRAHDYFLPLLIFIYVGFANGEKFKWIKYLGMAAIAASFIYMVYAAIVLHHVDFAFFTQFFPLNLLLMFLLFRNQPFNRILLAMFAFLVIANVVAWTHDGVSWPGNSANLREARNSIIAAGMKDPVNINPKNISRPIKYMEIPVSITDPLSVRLGTAADILLRYLKLVVLPYPMSYYYGYSEIVAVPLMSAVALISIIIHLLLLVAGFLFIRRNTLIAFGILFYLLSISLFTDLVMPVPGMMADRFLLIPSLGFCFVLAALIFHLTKFATVKAGYVLKLSEWPGALKGTLAAILVMYSIAIVARNSDWKDHLTLFRNDINHVENSAQAHNLLALHLLLAANNERDIVQQQKLRQESIEHFKRALEIYPQFINASYDLGREYEIMGQHDDAYRQFVYTCKLDSSFAPPCFAMAVIQHNKGNFMEAIPLYEKFLRSYPEQMEAYANLSYAYYQAKQFDKSIETNKRALLIKPDALNPHINIAKTFLEMGEKDSALYYFELAQRINPADASVNGEINKLKQRP